MNVEIAALADYANVAQGDKLNISGIFNAIWVNDFPAIHPSMVLALRLVLEYEDGGKDHVLGVLIEDPDGKQFAKAEATFATPKIQPGQVLTANHVLQFNGVGMKKPGKVIFRIVWDGETKQQVYLHVMQKK